MSLFRVFLGPLVCMLLMPAPILWAEARPAISMYGQPALPPDFVSLPYANPEAPQGGELKIGAVGGFDSVNPHILKGRSPWQLRFWNYESLMGRSWDEPFTLYGLLAESIEVGTNREWVRFTLRPEARFSDGSPVTVEDVIWSYKTLGVEGHWRYRGLWSKISSAVATGPRSVTFTFSDPNPELALLAGMRPILKKAQWQDLDFSASGLDIIPITTAPYQISALEAGKFIELTRNPEYWGAHLPFRKGTQNFERLRIDYFGDATALFEAFKAGEVDIFREGNAEKWATQFEFPAIASGRVVKSEIPHARPSGMRGLVMNSRRALFADWRVRDAFIHAFNFEYINEAQNANRQARISSYFSNSSLALQPGVAPEEVANILAQYSKQLLPGTLEGMVLPKSDGSLGNRKNMRKAQLLLAQAGYKVRDGVLMNPQAAPVRFEILLRQGAQEYKSILDIYSQALQRLGVEVEISLVDGAQYAERIRALDFDMTPYRRDLSLSPGNEQKLYWSSEMADVDGTRNLMGVKSAALDSLIEGLVHAKSHDDVQTITRAMDRVLMAGRYVIPIYHDGVSRIAHKANLKYPDHLPLYGDRIGFLPDVWWVEK